LTAWLSGIEAEAQQADDDEHARTRGDSVHDEVEVAETVEYEFTDGDLTTLTTPSGQTVV
jgi:hypothetical protein